MALSDTPWVDRTLTNLWDRVRAAAPKPEWVPLHEVGPRGRIRAEEYGCGHYGCVMPTSDPAVVCKLTSDPTEGAFVSAALSLDYVPDGIVKYHAIYAAPDATYRKRPLFVLWRESATAVGMGQMVQQTPDRYESGMLAKLGYSLRVYKVAASEVRGVLKRSRAPFEAVEAAKRFEDWAWDKVAEIDWDSLSDSNAESMLRRFDGVQRVALGLRMCATLSEWMENTHKSELVGGALSFYQENDMLLADVHVGNIGYVERTDRTPVITDPGHAVPLSARWQKISTPVLPG